MMDNLKSLLPVMLKQNKHIDMLEKTCDMKKSSSVSEEYRDKGNKLYNQAKHNRTEHKQLISLYTASISFALKDSEDLAKGFGNRSAVLMHMHRYKEALVDIDRALLVSKSDDYKRKLESRRERCLNLVDESKVKLPDELPKIHPNVKFPSASDAVDVAYNEKFGRHFVATRDIKPGQVIVAEEGYAGFPDCDRLYFLCSHCLRFAWNGIPCETCVLTIFCSEECKNEAWDEYHDVECAIIRTMFLVTNPKSSASKAMVIVRSFVKAVKTEGLAAVIDEAKRSSKLNDDHDVEKLLSGGVLDSKKIRSYYNLSSKTEDEVIDADGISFTFKSSVLLFTLLHRCTNIIPLGKLEDFNSADNELVMDTIKAIMRLTNSITHNNYVYQAPFCDCIDINECRTLCDITRGTLVAGTCKLFNHSCCRNVSRLFVGKKVVIFTTAPIKKGEQICESYGPVFTQSKEVRHKYLKEHHNFICNCQACTEDWPDDLMMEIYKNPIASLPMFDTFMKELDKVYPDMEKHGFNYTHILFGFIHENPPSKLTLDAVTTVSSLVYKHFNYQTAYYTCLRLSLYIENAFLKFYGENCVIPNSC